MKRNIRHIPSSLFKNSLHLCLNNLSILINALYSFFFLYLFTEHEETPEEHAQHHLFSRVTRIQARVTREVVQTSNVHGTRREHREKREIPLSTTVHPVRKNNNHSSIKIYIFYACASFSQAYSLIIVMANKNEHKTHLLLYS